MCMLDASKEFDRVNLLLLFTKLPQRGRCLLFLCVFKDNTLQFL